MGRFINADDRIVDNGNLFSYCKNNPVNASDPDGHKFNIWSKIKNSKAGKAINNALGWFKKNISVQNKTVIESKEKIYVNIDALIYNLKITRKDVKEVSSGKKETNNVYSSTNKTDGSISLGIDGTYNSIAVVMDGNMYGNSATMKGSLADVSVSNVSNIFCSKKSLDVFTKDDYVYSVDIVMSEALIAGIVTVAVVYGPALIPIVTAVANRFGQYGRPLGELGGR